MNTAELPSISGPYTYFHVLLDDPQVFVISSGMLFSSGVALSLKKAAGKRCFIVVQPSWNLEYQAKELFERVISVRRSNYNVQFMFMCSTLGELRVMRALGLEAFLIHKNAFIDDRIFTPDASIEKKYSAIHVANTEKFKRHYLAWEIKNIAVVTYSFRGEVDLTELGGYMHLSYGNFLHPHTINTLPPLEVSKIICASACGLVLSEEEGANNASTEYLLCGIPVISTPSKGGRDMYFDDRCARIVPPDIEAIKDAIHVFCQSPINPIEIRNSVLEKMKVHRRNLIAWLCMISGRDLFADANDNFWIPQFKNKLRSTIRLE